MKARQSDRNGESRCPASSQRRLNVGVTNIRSTEAGDGNTAGACVVKALVSYPGDGEPRVRAFAKQRFIRDHAGENHILEAKAKAAGMKLHDTATKKAKVDRHIVGASDLIERPPQGTNTPWFRPSEAVLLFVFLGLSLVAWFNAARYAVDLTQDWLRAFLFTSALPCIPLALKFFINGAEGRAYRIILRWLAAVGGVAAAVFITAFAQEFALEPSFENASELLRRTDLRALFISQVVLELVAGTAIFLWFDRLQRERTEWVLTPWLSPLEKRQAELLDAACTETIRLGGIQADQAAYQATLEVHVETAVAMFHQYRKQRDESAELLKQLAEFV